MLEYTFKIRITINVLDANLHSNLGANTTKHNLETHAEYGEAAHKSNFECEEEFMQKDVRPLHTHSTPSSWSLESSTSNLYNALSVKDATPVRKVKRVNIQLGNNQEYPYQPTISSQTSKHERNRRGILRPFTQSLLKCFR